jgi:hypothetical protein
LLEIGRQNGNWKFLGYERCDRARSREKINESISTRNTIIEQVPKPIEEHCSL